MTLLVIEFSRVIGEGWNYNPNQKVTKLLTVWKYRKEYKKGQINTYIVTLHENRPSK